MLLKLILLSHLAEGTNIPGFIVSGSGGSGPSNLTELRRKHRWTWTVLKPFSVQGLLVLQKASRPKFEFEEPKMSHNQEDSYYSGRQKWEPIALVWYDTEQQPDTSAGVYAWLGTVVDLTVANVASPSVYKTQATLQMEDGFGNADETWDLYGCWPKDVNWGELDYAATELMTIEASIRFDRALRRCGNTSGNNTTSMIC